MSSASRDGLGRTGGGVQSDDIARLNGALAANVRFRVVEPAPRAATADARRAGSAAGVLIARLADGRERRASSPLAPAFGRRAGLLLLSGCLAECAMSLGLGMAVYRKSVSRGGGAGRGAP